MWKAMSCEYVRVTYHASLVNYYLKIRYPRELTIELRYGVSGRDRMSFLYMNQLFAMAEDVGLNSSELDSTFDPKMLRARRIAIWGLYISTM